MCCGKQKLRKERSITSLAEGRCKILHLEWNNPTPQLWLGQAASKGRKGAGSSAGGQVEHKLAVCPGSKNQLCSNHLHQEYTVQMWFPQYNKYPEAQWTATKLAKGLQHLVHRKKLREMDLGWRGSLRIGWWKFWRKWTLTLPQKDASSFHWCGNGNSNGN